MDKLSLAKLNLGCGQNKFNEFINVDKFIECNPDIVCDLESFPWVFEDDSAKEVIFCHSLEHMGAQADTFLSIMKEVYRVCANDAEVIVRVPHPRSDHFVDDPTHVRPITPRMFTLFSKKKNQEWKDGGFSNTPLAFYLNVDFEIEAVHYQLNDYWKNKPMTQDELQYAAATYFNVVDEVTIKLKVIK